MCLSVFHLTWSTSTPMMRGTGQFSRSGAAIRVAYSRRISAISSHHAILFAAFLGASSLSTLPPIADMRADMVHVRLVPIADIAARLFDHLAGEGEQFLRHRQPERLGCFEIDDQVEFCRLHHRQIAWLFAFKDSTGIDTRLPV
jgi:hypothetical protein